MINFRQYALHLGLLLPSLWIFLTLTGSPSASRQLLINQRTIESMQKEIESFQESYNRLPEDMAELRAYIRSTDHRFSPYDPWGSRYQYEKLTNEWYFLKSFGKDAAENHLANYIDQTYIKMKPLPKRPPIHLAGDQFALNLYPGALLLAAQSPSNPHVAELLINSSSQSKRLIIRNLLETSFILPAFHDQVHEFFWLSNGFEIVFIATGSRRYQDGIYIWNLISNTTKNLLPDLKAQFPTIQRDRLYISLSTVDHKSQRIFVFVHGMEQPFLDPSDFYHTANLYGIILPTGRGTDEMRFERYDTADLNIFQRQIHPQGILLGSFQGYPAQQEWLTLPNTGSIQVVLEEWQSYCARYSKLPVFPYCLWWLASLYHDTYSLLSASKPKEAHVLRNFGVEIAQALDQLETAPDYLRAMGLFLQNSLLENKPAAYRISNLKP